MTLSVSKGWVRTNRPGGAHDTEAFQEFRSILNALYDLAGRGAAVDLGCGHAHVTRDWGMCTLVDIVPRTIPARSMVLGDIRTFPDHCYESGQRFDLMLMVDVIEHLIESEGCALVTAMEPFCKAQVIFTPVGPFENDKGGDSPDTHKSAWYPEQFWSSGWTVWEWPVMHSFPAGQTLGAFWAWKWKDGSTPTVEAVAAKAGVAI